MITSPIIISTYLMIVAIDWLTPGSRPYRGKTLRDKNLLIREEMATKRTNDTSRMINPLVVKGFSPTLKSCAFQTSLIHSRKGFRLSISNSY